MDRRSVLKAAMALLPTGLCAKMGLVLPRDGEQVPAADAGAVSVEPESDMAFLRRSLVSAGLDLPVMRPIGFTHQRDITVKFGGGYPQFISFPANAESGGLDTEFHDREKFLDEAAEAEQRRENAKNGLWPTFPWCESCVITLFDIKRLRYAESNSTAFPVSLHVLVQKAISAKWHSMLGDLVYQGYAGMAGLLNNPDAATFEVPSGDLTTTAWDSKTPRQIAHDIHAALLQSPESDTLLVTTRYGELLGQPLIVNSQGYDSLADNIRSILKRPDLKIFSVNGMPEGTAVLYRNHPDSVRLSVPTSPTMEMILPTTKQGGGYEVIYLGCVSSVIFNKNDQVYLRGV